MSPCFYFYCSLPIRLPVSISIPLCLSVPLTILWWVYRSHRSQLVLPLFSCSIVFFRSQARSRYLSLFLLSFYFTLWSAETAKSTISQVTPTHTHTHFFFIIITRSDHLIENMWSVCISKSQRSLYVPFSWTDSGLCNLLVWSDLNFLQNSHWITLPTQSCLVLYSFCANLLHSLIMWLIVSSISPNNLHPLFCCVLSLLALI